MGVLTEQEIFDCLKSNLRLAAQNCDKLAVSPRKGPAYRRLRDELRLIEGACRQAAYWRGDARWLRIGLYMAEVHKRAGDWLRGVKQIDGRRVKIAPGQLHPLFSKLAENLRAAYVKASDFQNKRTDRVGLILPKPQPPRENRDTRPVGYTPSAGGILMPQ